MNALLLASLLAALTRAIEITKKDWDAQHLALIDFASPTGATPHPARQAWSTAGEDGGQNCLRQIFCAVVWPLQKDEACMGQAHAGRLCGSASTGGGGKVTRSAPSAVSCHAWSYLCPVPAPCGLVQEYADHENILVADVAF